MPGWLWLLVGLGLGVAAVLSVELLTNRGGDALSGSPAGKPSEKTEAAAAPEPAAKVAKPKFDFYTILPETETVLPERETRAPKKAARAEPQSEENYYVLQAASYASFKEADELKARLALLGLETHIQKVVIEGRGEFHRVRLGPFKNIEELDAAAHTLATLGLKPLRLKVKRQDA